MMREQVRPDQSQHRALRHLAHDLGIDREDRLHLIELNASDLKPADRFLRGADRGTGVLRCGEPQRASQLSIERHESRAGIEREDAGRVAARLGNRGADQKNALDILERPQLRVLLPHLGA